MKKSRKSHNRAGTRYNKTRQADPHILDRLFQFLSPEKDKLYLDIGCGTGNYTIGLSERGINFWGVDPSIPMILVAKKNLKKLIGQLVLQRIFRPMKVHSMGLSPH
jgi:ubiquinone/menaquinone biosynthesis C-methylase UbiE